MKKILVGIVVGAIVASASADSINFKWKGVDGDATAADTLITSLGAGGQLNAIINFTANTVNLDDLQGLTWLAALQIQEVPALFGGGVDTPSITKIDMGYAGMTAEGIIVSGGSSYNTIADVQIGDTFDLTTGYVLADAGATPGTPDNLSIAPQGVTIEVIPEPATIGLMGVAGLGMYLARRKTRR